MTGLLPMLGAGLAVALLVLLAARLGFRGVPQLADVQEAGRIAASLPGGFTPSDVLLDRKRRGALLADGHGRVALVAPFGAHFIARELAPQTVVEARDGQLDITIDGLHARLDLGTAAQAWQNRIAQTGAPA